MTLKNYLAKKERGELKIDRFQRRMAVALADTQLVQARVLYSFTFPFPPQPPVKNNEWANACALGQEPADGSLRFGRRRCLTRKSITGRMCGRCRRTARCASAGLCCCPTRRRAPRWPPTWATPRLASLPSSPLSSPLPLSLPPLIPRSLATDLGDPEARLFSLFLSMLPFLS